MSQPVLRTLAAHARRLSTRPAGRTAPPRPAATHALPAHARAWRDGQPPRGPARTRVQLAAPYERSDEAAPTYPRRRNAKHRSAALLTALAEEERLRLLQQKRAVLPLKVPRPRAGDIVRVAYRQTDVRPAAGVQAADLPVRYFAGIVVSFRRRGLASGLVLRNVVDGVAVERGFPYYSPAVVDAWTIGRIKRRVRTSKLWYLRDLPLRHSTVAGATARPTPAELGDETDKGGQA